MEQALARRPGGARRRLPRLQPLARGGLGLRLPGAHLRRAYITLVDPDAAVEELEWALARDARFLAPAARPGHRRRPAAARRRDPIFDPFWARINEAGVTVVDPRRRQPVLELPAPTGASRPTMEAFRQNPFRSIVSVERDAGHVRQPPRPPHFRPLPEPADRRHRDRLGLGAPPPPEAQEVVGADAARLRRRTRARRSSATSGCRRSTRTRSTSCATCSAPTTS